ncbi:RNA polymerase sigma-70 factor (ECF subfamily) [Fictibacillus halophilus]|uniref:RNA polymerase sigma-70 factor (ECF subfamily) n=1 Tax=Fictibacillus halophilus TaxID=1610490 RepID=A0ABV2LEA7_9BACL|nr:sigma-70 family RNA polymerase sigma factor [Fictibacillus halophilus]
MKVTEENVVQQLIDKNENAISFMIQQYGGLLTAIIKRHVNYQQQDYEECLDDVLLSVWNNVHSFDPTKNTFKQWIAAVAKYKAIDYGRRQISLQKQQFSVPDFTESNLLSQKSREEILVDELLQQLPPGERRIFEKYYLEGNTSSEIAHEYNERESWVYNKLSRGRKKLKGFLFQNNEA